MRGRLCALLIVMGLAWLAPQAAAAPAASVLTAQAATPVVEASSLVRVQGRLTDAAGRPLPGRTIDLEVAGAIMSAAMTLDHGTFEAFAPVPDGLSPAEQLTVTVRFGGTPDAQPARTSLTVQVIGAAVAEVALPAVAPTPTKKSTKTPKPTPSAASATPTPEPRPVQDDPLLRNLLMAAGVLFALMVLLFVIGAIRRRRR